MPIKFKFTQKGIDKGYNLLIKKEVFTKKEAKNALVPLVGKKTIGEIYERVVEESKPGKVRSTSYVSDILLSAIDDQDERDRVVGLEFIDALSFFDSLGQKIEHLGNYSKEELGNKDFLYCQKLLEGLKEIKAKQEDVTEEKLLDPEFNEPEEPGEDDRPPEIIIALEGVSDINEAAKIANYDWMKQIDVVNAEKKADVSKTGKKITILEAYAKTADFGTIEIITFQKVLDGLYQIQKKEIDIKPEGEVAPPEEPEVITNDHKGRCEWCGLLMNIVEAKTECPSTNCGNTGKKKLKMVLRDFIVEEQKTIQFEEPSKADMIQTLRQVDLDVIRDFMLEKDSPKEDIIALTEVVDLIEGLELSGHLEDVNNMEVTIGWEEYIQNNHYEIWQAFKEKEKATSSEAVFKYDEMRERESMNSPHRHRD